MFVSKSLDYAFRALTCLCQRQERIGVKELARETAIPESYCSKILRQLVKARIVSSESGPKGGYSLVRPAQEITVAEVYNAVEGTFQVVSCSDGSHDCTQVDNCSQMPMWNKLESQIIRLLEQSTLADFLPQSSQVGLTGVNPEKVFVPIKSLSNTASA